LLILGLLFSGGTGRAGKAFKSGFRKRLLAKAIGGIIKRGLLETVPKKLTSI
jgi:hypothetical protein